MRKIGMAVGATLAGGVVLVASIVVAGTVFASGRGPPTATATQSSTAATLPDGGTPGLLAGADHGTGTWMYTNQSTFQTTSDFGRITSLANESVTVLRADGQTVTVPTSATTCIRLDGEPATFAQLRVGQRALATQEDGSAAAIRAGMPLVDGRNPCGVLAGVIHGDITVSYRDGSRRSFTYDLGRITGITATQIAILRRDRQSVMFAYDRTTWVLEDGHRVPVSDLKVGEGAMFIGEGGHADVIRCVQPAS